VRFWVETRQYSDEAFVDECKAALPVCATCFNSNRVKNRSRAWQPVLRQRLDRSLTVDEKPPQVPFLRLRQHVAENHAVSKKIEPELYTCQGRRLRGFGMPDGADAGCDKLTLCWSRIFFYQAKGQYTAARQP
jgi:hypothetical protein